MHTLIRIAIASAGCAAALCADQITLKNGDRVTGKVVKKDGAKLTFKSDHLGEVTLEWQQVESVRTDEAVNVVLSSGDSTSSVLRTEADKLQVTVANAVREVPLEQVQALRDAAEQRTWERLQRPSFLDLWSGSATIGPAHKATRRQQPSRQA